MDHNLSLGSRAYRHIQELLNRIGPRPAGSTAERSALDYINMELIRFGYQPDQQVFGFAPLPNLYWYNMVGGILVMLSSVLSSWFPYLTIFIPLVVAALPDIGRWDIRHRKHTEQSANVVAYTGQEDDKPLVILCAHVDSSRALPHKPKIFHYLSYYSIDILQRVAILIAIVSLSKLIGLILPNIFWLLMAVAGTVVGLGYGSLDLWNQKAHKFRYSPGALDNASGVGVLLALAEYYSEIPPKRINIAFLFTGAEECGLFGAAYFAKTIHETGRKMAVINVDMVGAGDKIQYVTREGVFHTGVTDDKMNRILKRAEPDVEPVRYTIRSGDFAEFLRNKIAAVSIQTSGSNKVTMAYHTQNDSLELVEIETVNRVANTLVRFIELIPYDLWG